MGLLAGMALGTSPHENVLLILSDCCIVAPAAIITYGGGCWFVDWLVGGCIANLAKST